MGTREQEMMTLGQVFQNLDDLSWRDWVYTDPTSISIDSECIVFDPDELPPDQEAPEAAVAAGLDESLSVADIRAIVKNAQQQGRGPTEQEFIQAFQFYIENDAFIEFDKSGES
jgi:hypothetical protein